MCGLQRGGCRQRALILVDLLEALARADEVQPALGVAHHLSSLREAVVVLRRHARAVRAAVVTEKSIVRTQEQESETASASTHLPSMTQRSPMSAATSSRSSMVSGSPGAGDSKSPLSQQWPTMTYLFRCKQCESVSVACCHRMARQGRTSWWRPSQRRCA